MKVYIDVLMHNGFGIVMIFLLLNVSCGKVLEKIGLKKSSRQSETPTLMNTVDTVDPVIDSVSESTSDISNPTQPTCSITQVMINNSCFETIPLFRWSKAYHDFRLEKAEDGIPPNLEYLSDGPAFMVLTKSASELLQSLGVQIKELHAAYQDESVVGYILATQEGSSLPIYHWIHADGGHLYSIFNPPGSLESYGFVYQEIIGYAFPFVQESDQCRNGEFLIGQQCNKAIPVFSSYLSDWFFSLYADREGVAQYGYQDGNTEFYVYPAGTILPYVVPFYRIYMSNNNYRISTSFEAEKNYFIQQGGKVELDANNNNQPVLGMISLIPRKGMVALYRLKHPAAPKIFYYATENSTSLTNAKQSHYQIDGLMGYVFSKGGRPLIPSYKVGAYYFGMFNHISGPSIVNSYWFNRSGDPACINSSSCTDPEYWWAGVKDLHEGLLPTDVNLPWWMPDYSVTDFAHLKPIIGYYDQTDKTVLERHIKQAKENGFSFFAFYWYWLTWNSSSAGEFWNEGLDSFLLADNSSDMQFFLNICEVGEGNLYIRENDFQTVAELIASKYLKKVNYMKDSSGRPTIQICDGRGFGTNVNPYATLSQFEAFITALKTASISQIGIEPYFTIRAEAAYKEPFKTYITSNKLNALSCLWYDFSTTPEDISSYSHSYPMENAYNLLNKISSYDIQGRNLMPCIPLTVDERPRLYSTYSTNAYSLKQDIKHLKDFSFDKFTMGLKNAKRWIDSHPTEASHIFTVYAWNEWHEGGIIEPNVKDKSLYLNNISEVFQLPIGKDTCRVTGDCKFLKPLLDRGPCAARGNPPDNPVTTNVAITNPVTRQVIQRDINNGADVLIEGTLDSNAYCVESRIVNSGETDQNIPWHKIAEDSEIGDSQQAFKFSGKIRVPAGGWYRVQVRAWKDNSYGPFAEIDKFGVGEVFVTAGQSNSTNCGNNNTGIQTPVEDRVSAASWNINSGWTWKFAQDPQPLVSDGSQGGSPWPSMGDALVAKFNVPIGILSVGFASTWVELWQPSVIQNRETCLDNPVVIDHNYLYPRLKAVLQYLGKGGVRAVLWHQGEADTSCGTPTSTYARLLQNVINQSRIDGSSDLFWFVASASYNGKSGYEQAQAGIRAGQALVVDDILTFAGPTTDDMLDGMRDSTGVHFNSVGLKEHGKRWADEISKIVR